MKSILPLNKRALTLLLTAFLFTVCSCKKNDNKPLDGEKSKVTFNVTGIIDVISEKPILKASLTNSVQSGYLDNSLDTDINLDKNVGFSYSTEINPMSNKLDEKVNSIHPRNSLSSLANKAVTLMDDGVKYWVSLYETDTDTHVGAQLVTVGIPVSFDIVTGKNYKWIAFSYNNSNNIAEPTDWDTPVIETPTNSDFLYATGNILAVSGNNVLDISFKHKLTQVIIELDSDRLFASIENYNVSISGFSSRKVDFNLKNGNRTNSTVYNTPSNLTLSSVPGSPEIKRVIFYTADPTTIGTISVSINTLKIKYINDSEHDILKITDSPKLASFTFTGDLDGKSLVSKVKLWYTFPVRKILHVTRTGFDHYAAYAAQPNADGVNHKAPYNMLKEPRNYGTLSNSVVRTLGFSHERISTNGSLGTYLAAATEKPDIIIIPVFYLMNALDQTELRDYLNEKGILLLMTDANNAADYTSHSDFVKLIFNSNTEIKPNGYDKGSLYKLRNIDDEILNGPFGDVRGKHWGEDDSQTAMMENYIPSDVTYYSDAVPINNSGSATGVTMFKHNTKFFFWIGDGGFLSNSVARGTYVSNTMHPFATGVNPIDALNLNWPISKAYGYAGNTILAGATQVYNSVIFANIMSWAIINAEFYGINKRTSYL